MMMCTFNCWYDLELQLVILTIKIRFKTKENSVSSVWYLSSVFFFIVRVVYYCCCWHWHFNFSVSLLLLLLRDRFYPLAISGKVTSNSWTKGSCGACTSYKKFEFSFSLLLINNGILSSSICRIEKQIINVGLPYANMPPGLRLQLIQSLNIIFFIF